MIINHYANTPVDVCSTAAQLTSQNKFVHLCLIKYEQEVSSAKIFSDTLVSALFNSVMICSEMVNFNSGY